MIPPEPEPPTPTPSYAVTSVSIENNSGSSLYYKVMVGATEYYHQIANGETYDFGFTVNAEPGLVISASYKKLVSGSYGNVKEYTLGSIQSEYLHLNFVTILWSSTIDWQDSTPTEVWS